ncbi:MAG TPA: precorrin-6y C5,15-methyltransferase (decarboxylating) subunit CbiE [Nitrospirota bacterium]|nr:precorrin-6y C5,15-methyltransferase (decarboxylating) subunit CbiE [Nitrospirota bacterium]
MLKAHKLHLIGIGYRPLGEHAREIVRNAGMILASSRLLDVFKRYEEYEAVKDRIKIIDKVPETLTYIKEWFSQPRSRSLILLASGDPFFFGIGRRIIEEFGRERVEVLPDLSSMQEAFARINLPWDDAFCISVHGGPDIAKRRALPYEVKDIPRLVEMHGKLAVLTDKQNNPGVIARVLKSAIQASAHLESPLAKGGQRGVKSEIIMHVCERLGYPDERIWQGTAAEAAGMSFNEPNVVILQKPGVRSQEPGVIYQTAGLRFGLKEEDLSHARGLITKDEVRAVAIHSLRLQERGVLWDIGAGSGSVGIEAARLFPGLTVIAVERDEVQVGHLKANVAKFDIRNIEIVQGLAPDVLGVLPNPDRVFIGGSGGQLGAIVEHASAKMPSGVIVINAATLETLQEGVDALERSGFMIDVSEISVSRSKPVAGKRLMIAMNPVFIVKGRRS